MKTSTGFGPGGATAHDVALMRATVGPDMGVKASGGIRSLEDLLTMCARAPIASAPAPESLSWRPHAADACPPPQPCASASEPNCSTSCSKCRPPSRRASPISTTALANIAEIIRKVVAYDLFAILLYNDKQKTLRIRYAIGHREEVIKNLVVHMNEGLTGTAAASRQPVLVGDVRKDPRYLNALDAVRSELAVPMLARGKLVGVIDVQSTRVDAYSEYDRSLLPHPGRARRRHDRQRAPVPPCRAAEQDPAPAVAALAGVLLDSGSRTSCSSGSPTRSRR